MPKLNTSSALLSFRIPLAQYQKLEKIRGDIPFSVLAKYSLLCCLSQGILEEEIAALPKPTEEIRNV